MNRVLYLILFFLLTNSFVLVSQSNSSIPEFMNEKAREKLFPKTDNFTVVFVLDNINRRSSTGVKKDELISVLKKKVTSQILTIVTTNTVMIQEETTNRGYSESFSSQTTISSSINLSDSYSTIIEYSRKNKRLYGIIVVNKKNLGIHYIRYFKEDYNLINSEFELYSVYNKAVKTIQHDINKYRKQLDNLITYTKIISVSGLNVPSDFAKSIAGLSSKLDIISKSLNLAEIEEVIIKAQKYFADKQYGMALETYEIAKLKLPEDSRIITGISLTKLKLEMEKVGNANDYKNKHQYNLAVYEYDMLFAKVPEVKSEYIKEYNMLEIEAFDKFAKELDFAMNNMSYKEVRISLSKLQKYQHVNRGKYNKYYSKVESYYASKLYDKAKIEYKDKQYMGSIRTIDDAIKIKSDSKFLSLKKKSRKKLYRIDLIELKKTRPYRYSIQLGGGIQSQNSLWSNYEKTDDIQFEYIPSVSIGFYRKFGGLTKVLSSGRDRSKMNLFGFRYTYVFQQGYDNNISDMNEFEMVVGFARKLLLNVGVASSKINHEIQNTSIDMYSVSLTRRFFMHPLEMQFAIKTYMDSNVNFYPLLKLSLFIHVNLNRNVNKNDKNKIRYNIENSI